MHRFATPHVHPYLPTGIPVLRFANGQRVRSAMSGDLGTVRERIGQQHTDNLYRVAWDEFPYDNDLYAEARLEEVLA